MGEHWRPDTRPAPSSVGCAHTPARDLFPRACRVGSLWSGRVRRAPVPDGPWGPLRQLTNLDVILSICSVSSFLCLPLQCLSSNMSS